MPTSRDIHTEIGKFIRGELQMSDTNYNRQDNHNERMWSDPRGKSNQATLEEFMA